MANKLGKPLFAKLNDAEVNINRTSTISVCVAITPDFKYPSSIQLRANGHTEDIMRELEYPSRIPKCHNCKGFDHWS